MSDEETEAPLVVDAAPLDLGEEYLAELRRVRDYAHTPGHELDFTKKDAPVRPGPEHRFTIKLPGSSTALHFTYAIDRRREDTRSRAIRGASDDGVASIAVRNVRHLTIQFSVPGAISQFEVQTQRDSFLAFMAPMVQPWFPLHAHVAASLMAHPAVPIRDVRARPEDQVVTYRTPVSAHFLVDADDLGAIAGEA